MSEGTDITTIHDEDVLYKMLNSVDDFDQRKKIRARMREVREARAAEIARQKKEREESAEDAVTMRQRQAEAAKQRKMAEYQERAKAGKTDVGIVEQSIRERHAKADAEKQQKLQNYTEMGKVMAQVYNSGSDILMKAEDDQQKRLKEMQEEGVTRNTKSEKTADGGTTTTATTVTTQKTKDGSMTTIKQSKQVTQTSGLGGTSYNVTKTSAAKQGPRGARAAFQQMDKATGPPAGSRPNFLGGGGNTGGGGGRVAVQRSPSAIKQMLLDWCKAMTREYEPKVSITNFSSSWNDGMAFCALIHHFFPKAFSFDELNPKARRANFTLAFDTAEKEADIAPLLDVEDMVRMKNPDWKCVFCYVQSFYRRFRAESGPQVQKEGENK